MPDAQRMISKAGDDVLAKTCQNHYDRMSKHLSMSATEKRQYGLHKHKPGGQIGLATAHQPIAPNSGRHLPTTNHTISCQHHNSNFPSVASVAADKKALALLSASGVVWR